MNYPLYPNPAIEPSNSSYGRWLVKVSDVTFYFFWKKAKAQAFLDQHKQQLKEQA